MCWNGRNRPNGIYGAWSKAARFSSGCGLQDCIFAPRKAKCRPKPRMNFIKSLTRIAACLCFWPLFVSAKSETAEQTVEIKCLLSAEKAAQFSKKTDLESKVPLTRVVCFFDTESQALFRHEPKVILRSRYDSSGEADTTVKVRNGQVRGNDAKCEFDEVLGKEKIMSCSLTDAEPRARIKKANAGKKVKKIFSKKQEATLEEVFGKVNWEELRPYGPVMGIQVWKKLKVPGGPNLTVERWKLPARSGEPAKVLFEVSTKVPLADEAKVSKWLAGELGLSENGDDGQSETKTRIVLEHFRSSAAQ